MILSLVTSVVIWLVIVYYVEPDKVQTIRNVPVTITADQVDALAALNLRIVDSEIETVARDCIGDTVAYILEWFGIPIDIEEAIRERDW